MNTPLSRRSFLGSAVVIAAPAFLRAAAPDVKVLDTRVISQDAEHYHGWPTLTQRRNGELLLAYSGGREAHVCPFGRAEFMTSRDGGQSWTRPRVLLDGPIDVRDAGVIETAKGTLLVSTFTSLAYEPVLAKGEAGGTWDAGKLARWRAAHQRLPAEKRKADLGVWIIRSTDDGVTWSPRIDSLVNSPHGPVPLADGRLLYAGKDLWRPGERVGVCESTDDGLTWRWLAPIPPRDGDAPAKYHELHAVQTADGRLLCHIRNHNAANDQETLQSESQDGGKTWSQPRSIGVWGLPSHLLKLRNGTLVMTYGHRRKPFGNMARISTDHGRTWSEPLTISADGVGVDLGYPSTVERADGTLVSVWYERMKESPRAVLRQAMWKFS